MRRKLTVAVLVAVTGTLFLFSACKKPGVVEEKPEPPSSQTEIPATQQVPIPADGSITPPPVRAVLDQEVGARWKAVEITVTEKKEDGQAYTVEIALDGEATVEGTPFTIKMLGFVPDFSMGADTITTKSLEDVNPAVKIQINEGETVLFTGWSFRDFPGMHSFDDSRYELHLTRAIPVE